MNEPVVLFEYAAQRVALTPEDAAFVAERLNDRIRIHRALRDDRYVLDPRQWVGVVKLPSGRQLECRPKVPARHLFRMLAATFDLPDPFLNEAADLDRVGEVLAFLVARFAGLLETLIDVGLYRAYVEVEDDLATVRGRIAVAEDIRRNHVLRHRTFCRFAEYAFDVPENQVLRQVVRLLASWGFDPRLQGRLMRLDAALGEVTPGRFAADDLDRFTYHRLNESYRPLHRLCQLFLEGTSVSEATGTFGFEAFLLDMNRLFEAFVTQELRDRAPMGVTVAAQRWVALDQDHLVWMRPDVVVRRDGLAVLVADCKYKRIAPGKHVPADLYQVLAYCTALGIDRGLLVYPRHLAPVDTNVVIHHAGVVIREMAINLGGSAAVLDRDCERLAQMAVSVATG